MKEGKRKSKERNKGSTETNLESIKIRVSQPKFLNETFDDLHRVCALKIPYFCLICVLSVTFVIIKATKARMAVLTNCLFVVWSGVKFLTNCLFVVWSRVKVVTNFIMVYRDPFVWSGVKVLMVLTDFIMVFRNMW